MLTGVAYFYADSNLDTNPEYKGYINNALIAGKCSVVILQVISAAFLGYGINKIRRFIGTTEQTTHEIDVCQLTTHALAFGLYLVSSLIMLFFLADSIRKNNNSESFFASLSVSQTLSFLSQLCLCWIFWQLSTKQVHPKELAKSAASTGSSKSGQPVVIIEEYDENAEVQARIWN